MKGLKMIRNNYNMLKIVIKNTPGYFIAYFGIFLMWALVTPFNNIYFIKKSFDMIERGENFYNVLFLVLIVIGINLICSLLDSIFWSYIDPKYRQLLFKKMRLNIFNKVVSLDQGCFDDPKFYDNYIWAVSESDTRALQVTQNFIGIISSIIQLIYIMGLIYNIDKLLLIFVLISVVFGHIINLKLVKLGFKRELEIRPLARKRDYISRTFYLLDYAKEIRLSNIKEVLFNYYKDEHAKITEKYRYFGNLFFGFTLLKDVFTTVVFEALAVVYLAYKAIIVKTVTVGGFTASISAMTQLYGGFASLIDGMRAIKENSIYIDKYNEFMDYKSKIIEKIDAESKKEFNNSIRFENVSFKYNEESKNVLKNISFTINKGEKIAIIGHNGAGKSTLIKLLLRLYDVTEGKIIIDNKDIRDININDYRGLFSSVMQNFNIYSCSIIENVAMDLDGDEEKAINSLTESGFYDKLKSLKNGLNNILLREFDDEGAILSGGESQKIALSRAFYSYKDIIILDEPSSALDPISEYNLNQKMKELSHDKTVIYISHRLSSTIMADKIFLLENGEIVERGNHDELMKLNGKYAEMFNMQAENYRIQTA